MPYQGPKGPSAIQVPRCYGADDCGRGRQCYRPLPFSPAETATPASGCWAASEGGVRSNLIWIPQGLAARAFSAKRGEPLRAPWSALASLLREHAKPNSATGAGCAGSGPWHAGGWGGQALGPRARTRMARHPPLETLPTGPHKGCPQGCVDYGSHQHGQGPANAVVLPLSRNLPFSERDQSTAPVVGHGSALGQSPLKATAGHGLAVKSKPGYGRGSLGDAHRAGAGRPAAMTPRLRPTFGQSRWPGAPGVAPLGAQGSVSALFCPRGPRAVPFGRRVRKLWVHTLRDVLWRIQ